MTVSLTVKRDVFAVFALRKIQHWRDVSSLGLRFYNVGMLDSAVARLHSRTRALCHSNFWILAYISDGNRAVYIGSGNELSNDSVEHLQVRLSEMGGGREKREEGERDEQQHMTILI
jgi:hypothetical protein